MGNALSEEEVRTIKRLAAAHGGRNVRVLASVREKPGSAAGPVFLVDLDEGRSLFDLVALTEDFGEVLGAEVNVLTEGSLSPYLRDVVLAAAVAL
jgi:uncharacterized protein